MRHGVHVPRPYICVLRGGYYDRKSTWLAPSSIPINSILQGVKDTGDLVSRCFLFQGLFVVSIYFSVYCGVRSLQMHQIAVKRTHSRFLPREPWTGFHLPHPLVFPVQAESTSLMCRPQVGSGRSSSGKVGDVGCGRANEALVTRPYSSASYEEHDISCG
jgi:hypothetical protein